MTTQTKLCFTIDGKLNIILDKQSSKHPDKDKDKGKGKGKDKCKDKIKKDLKNKPETNKEIKKPLPPEYKPPKDLNQYGAPLPQIPSGFKITSKLTYLDELIKKLINKAGHNTNLIEKIKTHYRIFESDDARLLISLFIRNIPNEERYYKRLATEFRLIKKKQFTKVFIQVLEILKISDSLGIPHIIRGSAGSSLICYLLKITDIDPILENISLARFMHTQRNDLPDIDMDFPSNRRDEIYMEIFKRYGNKVARISNHVKYSEKTAIKQAIRESGYKKFIPKEYELTDIIEEDQIDDIYKRADELEGEFKHYSLHCGGIIIFDKPIPEEYILKCHDEIDSKSKITMETISWQQVSLNKDQVDDFMFIKIDILSNRGLTELWDIDQRPIENYPYDPEVYKSLGNGNNIGIVYAESRAMRKALICLKPGDIQGIALALAIIRPVAREHKTAYFKDYNDYKAILEDVKNGRAIDGNKPIDDGVKLGDYIIYDDDAIQLIQRLLSCNEADADIYRKAFAKNIWDKKRDFEKRLRYKHPEYSEDKIQLIIEQLCNLQAYSFCKSHAISYAKLVYALAYCRVHKPIEFWISALNNCNSSYRKWVHYREAVAAGIKLTRGYSPWKWCPETQQIISISDRKIPILPEEDELYSGIDEKNKLEYFRLGYWCDSKFISGCYLLRDTEPSIIRKRSINEKGEKIIIEEKVHYWRFKGLISNYRCCKTWKKIITNINTTNTTNTKPIKERNITFTTLGYDNGKYIDIVLYGKIGLSKCHILEGYGIMIDEEHASWIKTKEWKPIHI